jgi:hypothetical protein
MKEHEMTEQQLLEEQLHAVTGGCANCARDTLSAAQSLKNAAILRAQSLSGREFNGNPLTEEQKVEKRHLADGHEARVTFLLNRVRERSLDPNHTWDDPHPNPNH